MFERKNMTYLILTIIAISTLGCLYFFKDFLSQNSNQISVILAHPIVLLLVGATISGTLIPTFTQREQDRKKKIEIKINMGREISQTVTQSIAICIAITNGKDTVEDQATCAINLKKIEVDLWTYFPKTELSADWLEYVQLLFGLWILTKHLWLESFDESDKAFLESAEKYHLKLKSKRNIDWAKIQTKDYLNPYLELRTSCSKNPRYS